MEDGDGEHGGDVTLFELEAHIEAEEENVPVGAIKLTPKNSVDFRALETYMTAHSVAPNIHWLYQYWYLPRMLQKRSGGRARGLPRLVEVVERHPPVIVAEHHIA